MVKRLSGGDLLPEVRETQEDAIAAQLAKAYKLGMEAGFKLGINHTHHNLYHTPT